MQHHLVKLFVQHQFVFLVEAGLVKADLVMDIER